MNEKCIPGLYPGDIIIADCPESEIKVHKALKHDLPPNWYAWHSLKIRTKEGKFGEADFLVADPNKGLLIVEVKGGKIKKEKGTWYTYERELKPPPFKQAHRFRTLLLEMFKKKNIQPPGIGVALCLSDTSFLEQPTQADIKDLVVGENRRIPENLMLEFVKYNLRTPYRCPPGIQALADRYVGKEADMDCVRDAVENGIVEIIRCEENAVHKRVGKAVNELLDEGFEEPEIAVLSLRGMGFEENIMHREELGGHAVKKATDPGAADHIICESFLRFKGLERPAVVVTDLRYVVDKYEVRMNIAVSRAVSALRIVGAEGEIEKDEMLRELG